MLHEEKSIDSTSFASARKLSRILAGMIAIVLYTTIAALAAPVVVTEQGPLRGLTVSGENQYLGIPYAAPPVGSLRWKPPQPPARFHGMYEATQFASACAQSSPVFGAPPGSEDCLYLNVYVPDVEPPPHGFPVMVWIHGGGFAAGAGSLYDPTPLVEKGNVIVVTINYRLGFLDFFAHPALDKEGQLNDNPVANYGLMDQQFALHWVRRHIGAFGGDHKNITIFGESAGGVSVLSNLASPTAAGLFQRGISESGATVEFQDYLEPISIVQLATAESDGTPFVPAGTTVATDLGCPGETEQTAQCLRAVTAATLVDMEPPQFFPIIDGTTLTQTLDSAFKSGAFNRVPVMVGGNHDEFRLFVALEYDLTGRPLTDAYYPAAVAALVGEPLAPAVLALYPLTNYPSSVSAPLALGAVGTDELFACPARNAVLALSKYVPTFTYEFNDETVPSFPGYLPPLSFPLGATHGTELEYLFDLSALGITLNLTADHQQLSDTMIGYWTQFAKSGNPNGRAGEENQHEADEEGVPHWPSYNKTAQFQSLVAPTPAPESDASFDADHKCSLFWNTF